MEHDERAATGSTSLALGPRDETWDAGEAQKSLNPDDFPKAHFWRDPSKPADEITAYKLPFAKRTSDGLQAVWKGVTSAAGRLGQTDLPDSDVAGVKTKIGAYYKKAANQYDDDTISVPWAAANTIGEPELRFAVAPITHVDVRDPSGNGDGSWTMSGYAAVFNQATVLYDGKFIRISESIDPAAFDTPLRTQPLQRPDGVVHYNLGHDMSRAVAATDVPANLEGSLQLSTDAHGLRFLAKVAKDDPDGIALASKLRTGVVRQASFAFTINRAEWTDTENADGPDESHRRILEVKHLYDVCACPQGAYSQTESGLRMYARSLGFQFGQSDLDGLRRQSAPADGGSTVNPPGGEAVVVPMRLDGDLLKRSEKHRRRAQAA